MYVAADHDTYQVASINSLRGLINIRTVLKPGSGLTNINVCTLAADLSHSALFIFRKQQAKSIPYPMGFSFFFFFPVPSALFFFWLKSLQLLILSSLVDSQSCSCCRFRFRSSISASAFLCSRPSSCICPFICLRRRCSLSISTSLDFSRHFLANSGVLSSGLSTVHLFSRMSSIRASAIASSNLSRCFSSISSV